MFILQSSCLFLCFPWKKALLPWKQYLFNSMCNLISNPIFLRDITVIILLNYSVKSSICWECFSFLLLGKSSQQFTWEFRPRLDKMCWELLIIFLPDMKLWEVPSFYKISSCKRMFAETKWLAPLPVTAIYFKSGSHPRLQFHGEKGCLSVEGMVHDFQKKGVFSG